MLAQADKPDTDHPLMKSLYEMIHARQPVDQAKHLTAFARTLYQHAAEQDLLGRDVADLYAAITSHWELIHKRSDTEPAVRIYSPVPSQDNTANAYSIVEIVTIDMPFLVDSVRMALNRHGLTVHLILHGALTVDRNTDGVVQNIELTGPDSINEAIIYVEVDRRTDPALFEQLRKDLVSVFADVRVAVTDWPAMRGKVQDILAELEAHPPPMDPEELVENKAFLRWIEDHHFTFLGYRQSEMVKTDDSNTLRVLPNTSLGVAKHTPIDSVNRIFSAMSPELRRTFSDPELLILTKTNGRATVHRPTYMDYIGIKRFDKSGNVIGEHRFLGLYTSAAYNLNSRDIPLLRRKVANVFARAGLARHSHNSKAFHNILETYPRDELFQIREHELLNNAMGILQLQERQRVRLFVRREIFGRFVSCIVYVPRERFDTEVRERITDILIQAFHGESVDYNVHLSESILARLYFIIHTPPGSEFSTDHDAIEKQINDGTRTWTDDLQQSLIQQLGDEKGNALYLKYKRAIPAAYRDDFNPAAAVRDILDIEKLSGPESLVQALYQPIDAVVDQFRFKIFSGGSAFALSDILPILENMGVRAIRERPYEIKPSSGQCVWIYDFTLSHTENNDLVIEQIKDNFQQTFSNVWTGKVENDGFNRLVLRAHLSCRDIIVLRAYCKYLRQTNITFSQSYMEEALNNNGPIARQLCELFKARFSLEKQEHANVYSSRLGAEIQDALENVASLDEDRILRSFFNVIQATVRSNYAQIDNNGRAKEYLSFKLDPTMIAELPLPRPQHEIFVYSPRVEGVHLRGGKVARGGIRWSDRREDFRTEILGLMKAQMVKNAIIVPVGAKGGFVIKQAPKSTDRSQLMEEVIQCYRLFISGLLDITDNIIDTSVVSPNALMRYDNDDLYLVVAADKGTASFSDIANGIANDYHYWLGDAFASGGSSGYDHKKMGITARGTWESVKRHFREIDKDIQNEEFTVIGIGDMSGDVFGNGMLLSPKIKLIAAFDHRHIFIDPNPDCALSLQERQRLFELPRSSWMDYKQDLISEGGGIFPRTAKSIHLTPQMRNVLDTEAGSLTPDALIRTILKAPVELFWNGGIGTYIKAEQESHSDVGDRNNDQVRINAKQLRCAIIGEGGNLGCTQKARIEFALNGGRINTDFIDNAGGVSCSDYEVNIKILLNIAIESGLLTLEQRNHLLVKMTDEVTEMVLQENYWQSWAISAMEKQASVLIDEHQRLIRRMEHDGKLDRELESLPSDNQIHERRQQNKGLTRPELAVMITYAKNDIYQQLLGSDAPEDPYLARELLRYFPVPLRDRFRNQAQQHRLKRELIATFVTNRIVNRLGTSFVFRMQEEYGASVAQIVRAYLSIWEIFGLKGLSAAVSALDNKVIADIQTDMLLASKYLVQRGTIWLLHHQHSDIDITQTILKYQSHAKTLSERLDQYLTNKQTHIHEQNEQPLLQAGVPAELATRVARLPRIYSLLDIIDLAEDTKVPTESVAKLYFSLETKLELDWLREQIMQLPTKNLWQSRARHALDDELYEQQRFIVQDILNLAEDGHNSDDLLSHWEQERRPSIARYHALRQDIIISSTCDLSMLSVALRAIQSLGQNT